MDSLQPRCARLTSLALLALFACGGEDTASGSDDAGGNDAGVSIPSTIGPEDRPARVIFPTAYDGSTPLPLVVLLHGKTTNATIQDAYWGLSRHSRANGYYLLLPDGTIDESGTQFWNATPACCADGGTGVDDVGYLRALVREMKERFPVDSGRVYFVGHSNGGYMSYRMACAMSEEVTAIGSVAGSRFATDEECGATLPVSVLQVHGNADDTMLYDGSASYPSAPEIVRWWAARAGCDTTSPTELDAIDLEVDLPGAETTVLRYETGCPDGVDAELWTIEGGSHVPVFQPDWPARLTGWLFRHARE